MAKKTMTNTYDSWEIPSRFLSNLILRDDSWMHYIWGPSQSKVFHYIFWAPPQISRDFLRSFFKPRGIKLITWGFLSFWSDKRGKVLRPASISEEVRLGLVKAPEFCKFLMPGFFCELLFSQPPPWPSIKQEKSRMLLHDFNIIAIVFAFKKNFTDSSNGNSTTCFFFVIDCLYM